MDQTSTSLGESVQDIILRLVMEAWEQHQEGVLLSRIGSEIAKKPEIAKSELGNRKLSPYIQEELSGKVRILPWPDNPIITIALPFDAPIDGVDISRYFPRADPGRKAVQASGVSNAILLAFSRPLAIDRKRVITLFPTARFIDVGIDAEVPESGKVLDRKWIVLSEHEPDSKERSRKILNNIAEWRQSVEIEPKAIAAKIKGDDSQARTVLDVLLSSLPEVDQKRIQLPLDIVLKLKNSLA